jgi:hypothetical protein
VPETDIFPVIPRYPVDRQLLSGHIDDEADSGRDHSRLRRAPRRVHHLQCEIPADQKQLLEQFYDQFRGSFFSFYDPVWGKKPDGTDLERYFSVKFAAEPSYSLTKNQIWKADCQLVDRIGAPLFQYPDPDDGHVTAFQEESDGFVVAGTWPSGPLAVSHGGRETSNDNLNTTDQFSWVYGGYGFRLWARRGPDQGIYEVLLDGVSLGTVDPYIAVDVASVIQLTKLDVPLGLHRVTIKATNTKNAASSSKIFVVDALETIG